MWKVGGRERGDYGGGPSHEYLTLRINLLWREFVPHTRACFAHTVPPLLLAPPLPPAHLTAPPLQKRARASLLSCLTARARWQRASCHPCLLLHTARTAPFTVPSRRAFTYAQHAASVAEGRDLFLYLAPACRCGHEQPAGGEKRAAWSVFQPCRSACIACLSL